MTVLSGSRGRSSASPNLVRAIGRWSLTGLAINLIIGSGIFGLPAEIARELRSAAPFAYLIAAAGVGVVIACTAEVASQFGQAGGPYLYARAAFGRFVGLETGWFAWLVRITSAAANANLFVVYLALFAPAAADPRIRAAVLIGLVGFLAVVNVRGVQAGTRVSDVFAIAKLAPIAIFVVTGLVFVGRDIHVGLSTAPAGQWLQAVLALVFAYGGFEAALMPMSEAANPRRDAPFALFAALAIVTVAYVLVHLVVMGAFLDSSMLDRPDVRSRPVAEAARVFLGSPGAAMIAVGVMISTYGNLASQFVTAPRLTFAFAEQGDFPAIFSRIHLRFRTPYVSVLVHALTVGALAIAGSFIWNAILSAAARLLTYAVICLAVPVFRRRAPHAQRFQMPGGWLLPALGVVFCLVIAANMDRTHLGVIVLVAAAGALNWAWARTRRPVLS